MVSRRRLGTMPTEDSKKRKIIELMREARAPLWRMDKPGVLLALSSNQSGPLGLLSSLYKLGVGYGEPTVCFFCQRSVTRRVSMVRYRGGFVPCHESCGNMANHISPEGKWRRRDAQTNRIGHRLG